MPKDDHAVAHAPGVPIVGQKKEKFSFADITLEFPFSYPDLCAWLEKLIASGTPVGPDWMYLFAAGSIQRELHERRLAKLEREVKDHRIAKLEKKVAALEKALRAKRS